MHAMSLALVVVFLSVGAPALAELAVRVDSREGAPRLLVNGRPVRGRMFFGGPGANPIPAGPEARSVSFEFTAAADAPGDGTLHFRFGQKTGRIWIDDVRVVDVETGEDVMPLRDFEQGPGSFGAHWIVFPPGEANTVGRAEVEPGAGRNGSAALGVTLTAPPDGRWPDYHIYHVGNLTIRRGRSYRVSFWCRAEPARDLTVNLYRPGEVFTHLGGPPGRFESQVRLAAGAGVDFVTFIVPTPWPEPGQPENWAAVDAECERVLRANPNALLIPRFGMEPPPWWLKAHPGDAMRWEDGSTQGYGVPASPRYRRDAAARAEALVRHLEERFPDRMAGYHPCGQNTGEWFYQDTWGGLLNGYADADREGWRAWLRARYRDDESLRRAWRDAGASIDAAEVPSPKDRRDSPNGVLRDPGAERILVDFAAYQQDAMADCVLEIAAATRRASRGRKLVVFFYGYGFEFGGVLLGPATSGHYALRRVLESTDIDVLCSPISYGDRGFGQTGPVMSCAESVALAGKLWLQEDDTRTHKSPDEPDAIARTATLEQALHVLTRNVANEATRNLATWWMDLGMAGWFDDPALWRRMRDLESLDRPFLQRAIPFRPEVAAVLDDPSQHLVAPWSQEVTGPIIYQGRWALGRMGAPYGQYLLDDVMAGRVGARLLVFLNTWRLSPERRAALLKATRGRTRVWCYAPGAYDEGGPSAEGMRALTGLRLERVTPDEAWATPTEAGRRLGLTRAFGLHKPVRPLFAATDAAPGEVLAAFPDGSAAVAMRRRSTGTDLFVGAPALTPELLRIAARAAAVHLWADRETLVNANGPIVAVTATQDGRVALDVRRRAPVVDVLTGQRLGSGPRLALALRKGETRVLRLETASRAAPLSGPQRRKRAP